MQVLSEVSVVIIQASHICTDIADLDYEHICERTKITGHRRVLLSESTVILCSLSYSTTNWRLFFFAEKHLVAGFL